MHVAVLGSIRDRVGSVNKIFLSGIRSDDGMVLQLLVSVPKSYPTEYDVMAYVLFIPIRLSDGNAKSDCPLGAFRKEWVNSGTRYTLPHIIIHTLHYNTTLTRLHLSSVHEIFLLLSFSQQQVSCTYYLFQQKCTLFQKL